MNFIAFSKTDKTKCFSFEAESQEEAASIATQGGYDQPREILMTFKVPKGSSREEAEAMAEAMIEGQSTRMQ